jgi:hypothetical protein
MNVIGKMRKEIGNHPLIKEWRKLVKKNGGCIQCQNPWYDGICDYKFSKKYSDLCFEIEKLVFNLEKEGWTL